MIILYLQMKFKLKKGKYYVGDPCYPFNKSWSKILTETDYFKDEEGMRKLGIYAGGTHFGDGIYLDNEDHEYYVDSGMLGIMDVSKLKLDNTILTASGLGYRIIDFKEDFEIEFDVNNKRGNFKFGNVEIDTE